MTAATTIRPMTGVGAVTLPVRDVEATSQWGPRVISSEGLLTFGDEGVEGAVRGAP